MNIEKGCYIKPFNSLSLALVIRISGGVYITSLGTYNDTDIEKVYKPSVISNSDTGEIREILLLSEEQIYENIE